jgi:hypothetical protein
MFIDFIVSSTYSTMICSKQILCHPAESNCGHTDFQSVALPTELGWQYKLKNDFVIRISFLNPFGDHPTVHSNPSPSTTRLAFLTARYAWRGEFNAPERICQQFIQMNFAGFIVSATGISF